MRGCLPVLLCVAAAPILSQTEPVIRVSVNLVQVDAVVTDARGHHVTNLKPADFLVLEDGKAQKITGFSYVEGSAPTGGAVSRAISGAPPEAVPAFSQALRQDQVNRTIVMIADDLGLSADDIPNVRNAMKRFVDQQMQAGDLVSIMTTSGGMGILQQLTNNKRQLYASIDRVHYEPGRTGQTWYEPTNIGDAARRVQTESNARLNAVRVPSKGIDTLGAVAYAIQGLREMPGRKAIALFSDGFPQSAGRLVELANRASVVVYTFDPRGLASFFLTAVDICTACPGAVIRGAERNREAAYRASQKSLSELAKGTGGVFFHDNNDLGQGLVSAVEDMSGYYLIGYQPQREDFDEVRGAPKFHKLEVKVLRAGLQVRSRNGFAGVPDAEDQAPSRTLRAALFSPFRANGFPVHLSAFYSAASEKAGHRTATLRAMLAIDSHQLQFKDLPQEKKQLELEVLAAAYDADNKVVGSSDKVFRVSMSEEELEQTVASGLMYGLDVAIPKPGPYQFRVAVRDANSDRLGSAVAFVEIPDFNRHGITLSSVLLSDSDPKRNDELSRDGVMGPGSPVTRVFGSGAVLTYDCTVFGVMADRQTSKPKIEVEINLFRGPEKIFTGHPIPLAVADGASTSGIRATGEIKLPDTLPAGDYAVELNIYDRLENPKLQRATQWVDFTLATPHP